MAEVGTLTRIRKTAMDLLSRREHSEQELKQKLKSRQHEIEAIDEVVRQLQQDGLQSDERFTESFINQRVNAGFGPIKIRYELRQRSIAEHLIDAYLEPFQDYWVQSMEEQRRRKYGETIPADYAMCMKQARFLQNRGFSPESVMRLFR